MSTFSKNTKVVLFADNFLEQQAVTRQQCITVQSYEYQFQRARNSFGEAYGNASDNIVLLTVKVSASYNTKAFYNSLTQDSPITLSLLANVLYDDNENMKDGGYDAAYIMEGYVVDIDECFHQAEEKSKNDELILSFRFLVGTMTVVGANHNITIQVNG